MTIGSGRTPPIEELDKLHAKPVPEIEDALRAFVRCVVVAQISPEQRDPVEERRCIESLRDAFATAAAFADVLGRIRLLRELPDANERAKAVAILSFAEEAVGPPDANWLRKLLGLGFDNAVEQLIGATPEVARKRSEIEDVYRRGGFSLIKAADIATVTAVRDAVTRALARGAPLSGVEEVMASLDKSFTPAYSRLVFRNATTRAYAAGRQRQAREMPGVVGLEVMSTEDPDVRRGREEDNGENHLAADGMIAAPDDPVWDKCTPPYGFNCLLPQTSVDPRGILWASRAWYTGDAVEIETRRGGRFSLTVNHPVATPQGFVAAGALVEGNQLLCDLGGRETVAHLAGVGQEDEDHDPACVEDMFDAFAAEGIIPVRPRVVSLDFHGEAERFVGEVDVVWADRDLWFELERQRLRDFTDEGMTRCGSSDPFATFGSTAAFHEPFLSAADGVVCGVSLGSSSFRVGLRPFEDFCFASASDRDARFGEAERESVSGNPQSVAQALERFATDVGTDDRVGVQIEAAGETGARRAKRPELLTSQPESFRRGSREDPGGKQSASNRGLLHPDGIGDLLHREPPFVEIDEVLRIRRFRWDGHVYDLQTATGIIPCVASSGTRNWLGNCRCTLRLVHRFEAERLGLELDERGVVARPIIPGEWEASAVGQVPPGFATAEGSWGQRADSIYRGGSLSG